MLLDVSFYQSKGLKTTPNLPEKACEVLYVIVRGRKRGWEKHVLYIFYIPEWGKQH